MSILVVGGAGYIGSHAARALRRQGYQVLIYENLSRGHAFLADGFELVVADIADRNQLSQAMRRVEAVMHFAASSLVGESVENPRLYFQNNVEAGLTLLNTALDAGIRGSSSPRLVRFTECQRRFLSRKIHPGNR